MNKYLHTVAFVGFLFTLKYDALNHELKICGNICYPFRILKQLHDIKYGEGPKLSIRNYSLPELRKSLFNLRSAPSVEQMQLARSSR